MKRNLMLAAAFILFGTVASALTADEVVQDLVGQGYTRVEVKTGPTQIKVEAIRGTEKLEVIYDSVTGAVLKSETGVVERSDDVTPGVEVSDRNHDFIKGGTGGDNGEDNGDDHGNDGNNGDDHGNDGEDNGDDHGSDGNNGDNHGDGGNQGGNDD